MRGYFGQLWRQTSVRYGSRAVSDQPSRSLEVDSRTWAAAPQGIGEMEAGADQEHDVVKVGVFGELIAEEPAEKQAAEARLRLGSQQPFPRSEPREHALESTSSPHVSGGTETPSFSAPAERLTREEKVTPHSNSLRVERQAKGPPSRGEDVVFAEDAGDAAPSFSASRNVLEKEHIIEKSDVQADAPDSVSRRRAISPELGQFGRDSAPAWQTAMQPVREWVATTPASNQASQKQQPSVMNEEVEPIFGQPLASRVVYRESSKQRPHLEAKSQEFHLSIGTISLTIEEPRPESQPITQPVAQPPSKPENRRSRLSRHYLRIT